MLLAAVQREICYIFNPIDEQIFQSMFNSAFQLQNRPREAVFALAFESPDIEAIFRDRIQNSGLRWKLRQSKHFSSPYVALQLTHHLCDADPLLVLDSGAVEAVIQQQKQFSEVDVMIFSCHQEARYAKTQYFLEDLLSNVLQAPRFPAAVLFNSRLLRQVFADETYVDAVNQLQRSKTCLADVFWLFVAANAQQCELIALSPLENHSDLISQAQQSCEQNQIQVMIEENALFNEYSEYLAAYFQRQTNL